MTDRDDLIAAYALDALSGEEQEEAKRLIERSPEAREALRQYQAMLAGLALLSSARSAPPAAADGLRARLAAESAPGPAPATPVRSTRRFPVRRLALSAAAILVVFAALLLASRLNRNPIDDILNDQTARTFKLNPQGQVGGWVSVVAVPGKAQAVLMSQLPELSPDLQYQLWWNVGGVRTSGGVFSPAVQGPQRILVTIPDLTKECRMGITVERAGGVDSPTMSPIFVGNLPWLQ